MSISLCIITKNEEKLLDKFLKTDGKDWIKWKKKKNKMSISYVLDFKINYLL